jgi:exodeoxyribonuclease-3
MKIATFNVNSIRARLPQLLEWLKETAPDVVLLQELKCLEEAFPQMEIEELGYNTAISGQKTYNGVAILSKFPMEDVVKRLPGDDSDEEARYIEAVINIPSHARQGGRASLEPRPIAEAGAEAGDIKIIRVASIYVPNGQEVGSAKFNYKLRFFDRLFAHAKELWSYNEPLILGGDYNVAPNPIDVFDATKLEGTVCYHPEERKRFHALLNHGFCEVWRANHPQEKAFSWWDYRGGSYERNLGMRIDHLLLSPEAADRVKATGIDSHIRGKDKASDHAPVWVEIV